MRLTHLALLLCLVSISFLLYTTSPKPHLKQCTIFIYDISEMQIPNNDKNIINGLLGHTRMLCEDVNKNDPL